MMYLRTDDSNVLLSITCICGGILGKMEILLAFQCYTNELQYSNCSLRRRKKKHCDRFSWRHKNASSFTV